MAELDNPNIENPNDPQAGAQVVPQATKPGPAQQTLALALATAVRLENIVPEAIDKFLFFSLFSFSIIYNFV